MLACSVPPVSGWTQGGLSAEMSKLRWRKRYCGAPALMVACRQSNKFMAEDNKNRDDGKKNGEFRVPPRTYILWIAILGAIPLLMIFRNAGPAQAERLTQ